MLTTPERRTSERARIPCHIPVELMDSARSAQFEADAVDLSVGGLSLRAAQLPDVGSQLYCAFEAMPGGAQVLGRGEVVWRQPQGEQGGEFGLRFIEVDAKNQALIDEMVAERVARIEARFSQPEPVMASLELENVADPVTARLVHAGEEHALFEQSLEQFGLGKAVVAHAGATLVRGHISQVTVRMEGATPRLMLTLDLARERSEFGEFMWNEPGSDTDPDVFSRDSDVDLALAQDAQDADYELPSMLDARGTLAGVGAHDSAAASGGTLAGVGHAATSSVMLPAPIYARAEPASVQLPLFKREQVQRSPTLPELGSLHLSHDGERRSEVPDNVFVDEERARAMLGSDYEPESDYESEEHTDPDVELAAWGEAPHADATADAEPESEPEVPPSPLVKLLAVPAMFSEAYRRLSEQLKERAGQLGSGSTQRIAGARGNLFAPKPRRVTASSSQRETPEHKQSMRVIVVGSLCILSLAVLAYVLTPASGEVGPHHAEQAAHDAAEMALAAPTPDQAPDAPTTRTVPEGTESSTLAATATTHGEAPSKPGAPASKPVASKPAAPKAAPPKAAPPKPTAPSMVFGQKQVLNPRRFLLRMADPVKGLQGSADAGGFSVVIAGNRALDRAAPLKSGHPAIEHAAIRNRKDNSAELSVRFAEGKSPAYRVTGQGSILEILIAQ